MDEMDGIFCRVIMLCLGVAAVFAFFSCIVLIAALSTSPCTDYPVNKFINGSTVRTQFGSQCYFANWLRAPICPLTGSVYQQADGGVYFQNNSLTPCAAPTLMIAIATLLYLIIASQFLLVTMGKAEYWRKYDYALYGSITTCISTLLMVFSAALLSFGLSTVCDALDKLTVCTQQQINSDTSFHCLRLPNAMLQFPRCTDFGARSPMYLFNIAASLAWTSVCFAILATIGYVLDVMANRTIQANTKSISLNHEVYEKPLKASNTQTTLCLEPDAAAADSNPGARMASRRFEVPMRQYGSSPGARPVEDRRKFYDSQFDNESHLETQRLSNFYQTGGIPLERLAAYANEESSMV